MNILLPPKTLDVHYVGTSLNEEVDEVLDFVQSLYPESVFLMLHPDQSLIKMTLICNGPRGTEWTIDIYKNTYLVYNHITKKIDRFSAKQFENLFDIVSHISPVFPENGNK